MSGCSMFSKEDTTWELVWKEQLWLCVLTTFDQLHRHSHPSHSALLITNPSASIPLTQRCPEPYPGHQLRGLTRASSAAHPQLLLS